MNIRHVVVYTLTVSAAELKEILNSLSESQHLDAQNLAVELQEQVDKSRKEIQRRFSVSHTVNYREDEREGKK